MADSNLTPAQKRALDSLQRPVIKTAEDIHPDHHKKPVEKKVDYNEMARKNAAGPRRHI